MRCVHAASSARSDHVTELLVEGLKILFLHSGARADQIHDTVSNLVIELLFRREIHVEFVSELVEKELAELVALGLTTEVHRSTGTHNRVLLWVHFILIFKIAVILS